MRFQRELKTPSTTFRYPSNILHLRNALLSHPKISKSAPSSQPQLFIIHFSSFIIFADNPAIPTITATPHYPSPCTAPISNSRHRRNHNYSLFIFHHSLSSPTTPPFPPSPPPHTILHLAPPQFQIRAIGATTIIHYSFFIIHYLRRQPATLHYPSPRTIKNQNPRRRRHHNSSFFIIHYSSFILHFPPSPAAPRSPSRSPPRRPASFFRPIHTRTCS